MAARAQGSLFGDQPAPVRRMRRATDGLIRTLQRAGKLQPEDEAAVALLRTQADAMDAVLAELEPNYWTLARLAGEWRAAHDLVRHAAGAHLDGELAAFFAGAEVPAP